MKRAEKRVAGVKGPTGWPKTNDISETTVREVLGCYIFSPSGVSVLLLLLLSVFFAGHSSVCLGLLPVARRHSDRTPCVAVRSILVVSIFLAFNSSDSFDLNGNNGRSTLADLHIKSNE
jgi:hypothetical protein